jgi:hypothetical protein
MLNTFIWDLLVEGGDDTAIKEQLQAFTKKSGSAFGHNEKVKLEAKTPDLKAHDALTGAQLLRNHILGAKCIPSFWYGGGQDANLAVSREMSAPTYKLLSKKQLSAKAMFRSICDEAIREGEAHGMLKGIPDDQRQYNINTPELASKDVTGFATAIQQLCSSLVAAENQEWVDKDTAIKIFAFCLDMIGYKIDVEAVTTAVENQKDNNGYQDYLKKGKTAPSDPANGGKGE